MIFRLFLVVFLPPPTPSRHPLGFSKYALITIKLYRIWDYNEIHIITMWFSGRSYTDFFSATFEKNLNFQGILTPWKWHHKWTALGPCVLNERRYQPEFLYFLSVLEKQKISLHKKGFLYLLLKSVIERSFFVQCIHSQNKN